MDSRDDSGSAPFGARLRRYRQAAGLTQEALAERAGLSERAVRGLERGDAHRARPDTVRLLAEALQLGAAERAAFEAAAREDAGPAWRVAARTGAALPPPPSPLVGREAQLADLRALLGRAGTRLVTLTGPAGVGKTRLGIQVAAEARGAFADGALYVPLSALAEPLLVAMAIAHVLGLHEDGTRPLGELIAAELAGTHLLLVLDNFEHLSGAAALVADLLARCPRLSVLVTSRAPLRLRGEHEYQVPPLALPDDGDSRTLDVLAAVPAVTLFLQRAAEVRPDFLLTPGNAQWVAALCRRLDGLPLALELAAPRLKLLPPRALLAQMERCLPLLEGGARDLPDRQRTMRNAVAWSYNLLLPIEQTVFRRLCIFAGSFSFDGAEALLQMAPGMSIGALAGLAALVDNSLARQVEGTDGGPRFQILQVIREYGLERMAEEREEEALQRTHAVYFTVWSERMAPGVAGPDGAQVLAQLEQEHDNLRMALFWATEHQEEEVALRLGAALWRFWWTCSYLDEGRHWLGRILAIGGGARPELRAQVKSGLEALDRRGEDSPHR